MFSKQKHIWANREVFDWSQTNIFEKYEKQINY